MSGGRRFVALLLVVLVLTAPACSGAQPDLAGTSWRLTGWAEPTPLPGSIQITVEFDNWTVSGSSGINSYNGPFTSSRDGSIRVGSLTATLMGGSAQAAAAETAYTNRLQAARGYRIDGDTLVLLDPDGEDSLTFTTA